MSATRVRRGRAEVLVEAVVVLAAAACLAAAGWSVLHARAAGAAHGPGEVVVDHGLARVDQVVSAARPQHGMPGMGTDNDPVADDERRVSVDVTLRAGDDEALRFDARRFALHAPGDAGRRPHRSVLPGDELPPGTQLSGTLVFDVPVDATRAELSYDAGPGTEVVLPPEGGDAEPTDPDGPTGPHPSGHDG